MHNILKNLNFTFLLNVYFKYLFIKIDATTVAMRNYNDHNRNIRNRNLKPWWHRDINDTKRQYSIPIEVKYGKQQPQNGRKGSISKVG